MRLKLFVSLGTLLSFFTSLYGPIASAQQNTVLEGSYYPNAHAPAPFVQAADEWTTLANALEPRVEGHSALIGGKIYVFGGFQTQDIVPTDKNEVYTPGSNSWATFKPLPHQVTHVGSAEFEGKVWLAGGFAVYKYTQITDSVFVYDSASNTWSRGPSLPQKRSAGSLVRLGRKLHYFSGLLNRNENAGDHYVLDLDEPGGPKTWTTAAPLPEPRDHLGGAAVGGKIYAIGGQTGHDANPQDTHFLHVYDPVSDSWTRLADLPYIRSHYEPGTLVIDGKIIIAGGRTGTQNCVNTVTQYNPETNAWSELFTMPACLLAPSAKLIGDELFLSHGGAVSVLFPTNAAHKRPYPRTPSDKLGFWPNTLSVNLEAGEAMTKETLIWTYTGEADYTIDTAGLPSWISNIDTGSGIADIPGDEVEVTLDATGLAAGVYSYMMPASASGYQNAELALTLTVSNGETSFQSLEAGWNLVGLPRTPANGSYQTVFNAVTPLGAPFGYEGDAYVQKATLVTGAGYWLNLANGGVQAHDGGALDFVSLPLPAGWSLISGPTCDFSLSDVTDNGGILDPGTLFGYNQSNGYTLADHLLPGRGYWIRTHAAGTISMNCPAIATSGHQTAKSVLTEGVDFAPRLVLTDARGLSRTLYLGETENPDRYVLPPLAPRGQVDVRFANNSRLLTESEGYIRLQAMQPPVSITLDSDAEAAFAIEFLQNDTWIPGGTLHPGGRVELGESRLEALRIRRGAPHDQAPAPTPTSFEVLSIFPNPFVSSATITYEAPADGRVRVEVYDMLGQRVFISPEETVTAGGRRTATIDGGALASGAYLYRLIVETNAGIEYQTGRIVRLR